LPTLSRAYSLSCPRLTDFAGRFFARSFSCRSPGAFPSHFLSDYVHVHAEEGATTAKRGAVACGRRELPMPEQRAAIYLAAFALRGGLNEKVPLCD